MRSAKGAAELFASAKAVDTSHVRPRPYVQREYNTVNFANNDCGYNNNSRITTEFPCPEQSPIPL